MGITELSLRRFTREEYYKMAEFGLFDGQRVELIEGVIVEMTPQLPAHTTAIFLTEDVLNAAFGKGYAVRTQAPLDLSPLSEPEPDVAVVAGTHRDYKDAHPTTALLVVEVSESTPETDRTYKASLYAKAGIQEYWVLNLVEQQLDVYRQPVPMPDAPYGHGYASVTIYQPKDSVSPLSAPDALIKVADLLP